MLNVSYYLLLIHGIDKIGKNGSNELGIYLLRTLIYMLNLNVKVNVHCADNILSVFDFQAYRYSSWWNRCYYLFIIIMYTSYTILCLLIKLHILYRYKTNFVYGILWWIKNKSIMYKNCKWFSPVSSKRETIWMIIVLSVSAWYSDTFYRVGISYTMHLYIGVKN